VGWDAVLLWLEKRLLRINDWALSAASVGIYAIVKQKSKQKFLSKVVERESLFQKPLFGTEIENFCFLFYLHGVCFKSEPVRHFPCPETVRGPAKPLTLLAK
jgi:hypothetical protein